MGGAVEFYLERMGGARRFVQLWGKRVGIASVLIAGLH